MTSSDDVSVAPRWLHWWAVLTVCATLPLLFLGAEVTTKGVGMADPRGFRPPWELLQILARDWLRLDIRIEYSHRLAGMVVGTAVIVLALGLWLGQARRSLRWLGIVALLLVCTQGILGIFRVELNEVVGRTLALVHGLFAQVVIATLVCLAVMTSRSWMSEGGEAGPALRRWSLVTALAIFAQLLLGGMTRHGDYPLGPRGHLLGAFVVLACVLWLWKLVLDSEQRERFLRPALVLSALVGLQLWLGVETWLTKFHVASADLPQVAPLSADVEVLSWIRSAHYVVGSFIFATAVALALKANAGTEPSIACAAGSLEAAL
jgi:cytochrome c oxidase assembly protein subunit 15